MVGESHSRVHVQGRCTGWINAVPCFGAEPQRWQLVVGLRRKQGQAVSSVSGSFQCPVYHRKDIAFL